MRRPGARTVYGTLARRHGGRACPPPHAVRVHAGPIVTQGLLLSWEGEGRGGGGDGVGLTVIETVTWPAWTR